MKIKPTDDVELRKQIQQALKNNENYCPCRLERTEDTKCICKDFREQKSGICYCGLYIKEED